MPKTIENCREFLEEIMQDLPITSIMYMKIYTFLGGVPKKRRPISVNNTSIAGEDGEITIFETCLCNDGTIWRRSTSTLAVCGGIVEVCGEIKNISACTGGSYPTVKIEME